MSMYIVLLIALLVLAIIGYFVFEKDILSPTIITILIYLFATFLAWIGYFSWNTVSISFKLVLIILSGIISFGIGEFAYRKMKSKLKKEPKAKKEGIYVYTKKQIDLKIWKQILLLVFVIITTFFMFTEMKRICIESGYEVSAFGEVLSTYRKISPLFSTKLLETKNTINVFVSQMKKVCDVICITITFVIFNNLVNNTWKKKNILNFCKKNILYVLIILSCYVLSLLTTGRAQLMKYIIAAFFIYILVNYKKNQGKDLLKKFLVVATSMVVVSVTVFYFMLPILGRETKTNFKDYISFYFGCSVPSFQLYLDNPPEKDEHFGSESLYGIQSFLYKMDLSDYVNPISREWVKISHFKSNVYTGYRRYLNDFGVIGVMICSFIFGFVFSHIYMNVKMKNDFRYLIFFAFYSYILIDQVRDELFFTRFIHINTVIHSILILLISWGLFDFEFSNIPLYKKMITKRLKR